jgi:hypothetical protein
VVEEVPQAALARLDLELFQDRRVGVVVVAARRAPLLVDGLSGEDLVPHEVPHPAADLLGFGGEREVHVRKVTADVTRVASG